MGCHILPSFSRKRKCLLGKSSNSKKELGLLEVSINKEVRNYQESIFFGLSLRQFLFSLMAVLVAVGLYFGLHHFVQSSAYDWLCVVAAFPFALGGFFTYNGMNAEQFMLTWFRSQFRYPRRLVFRSENLYARALDESVCKEAFILD